MRAPRVRGQEVQKIFITLSSFRVERVLSAEYLGRVREALLRNQNQQALYDALRQAALADIAQQNSDRGLSEQKLQGILRRYLQLILKGQLKREASRVPANRVIEAARVRQDAQNSRHLQVILCLHVPVSWLNPVYYQSAQSKNLEAKKNLVQIGIAFNVPDKQKVSAATSDTINPRRLFRRKAISRVALEQYSVFDSLIAEAFWNAYVADTNSCFGGIFSRSGLKDTWGGTGNGTDFLKSLCEGLIALEDCCSSCFSIFSYTGGRRKKLLSNLLGIDASQLKAALQQNSASELLGSIRQYVLGQLDVAKNQSVKESSEVAGSTGSAAALADLECHLRTPSGGGGSLGDYKCFRRDAGWRSRSLSASYRGLRW